MSASFPSSSGWEPYGSSQQGGKGVAPSRLLGWRPSATRGRGAGVSLGRFVVPEGWRGRAGRAERPGVAENAGGEEGAGALGDAFKKEREERGRVARGVAEFAAAEKEGRVLDHVDAVKEEVRALRAEVTALGGELEVGNGVRVGMQDSVRGVVVEEIGRARRATEGVVRDEMGALKVFVEDRFRLIVREEVEIAVDARVGVVAERLEVVGAAVKELVETDVLREKKRVKERDTSSIALERLEDLGAAISQLIEMQAVRERERSRDRNRGRIFQRFTPVVCEPQALTTRQPKSPATPATLSARAPFAASRRTIYRDDARANSSAAPAVKLVSPKSAAAADSDELHVPQSAARDIPEADEESIFEDDDPPVAAAAPRAPTRSLSESPTLPSAWDAALRDRAINQSFSDSDSFTSRAWRPAADAVFTHVARGRISKSARRSRR